MKKLFLFFVFIPIVHAQGLLGIALAKEFAKDVAVFQAKKFLITDVLENPAQTVPFEIDALSASSSLEVISVWYKCQDLHKEGLILGFYGNYWNDEGVVYTGYAFKNLPEPEAVAFISKVDSVKTSYSKWTNAESGTRNVSFTYQDITMIFYTPEELVGETVVRLFWKGVDVTWNSAAYNKAKKRLFKKMD